MAVLLQTRTEDGVAILTLNRPASRNAMDVELAEALHDSLAAMAQDDKIGCVVLRGAGGNFMSGGDVKYFHRIQDRLTKELAIRFLFGGLLVQNQRIIPPRQHGWLLEPQCTRGKLSG